MLYKKNIKNTTKFFRIEKNFFQTTITNFQLKYIFTPRFINRWSNKTENYPQTPKTPLKIASNLSSVQLRECNPKWHPEGTCSELLDCCRSLAAEKNFQWDFVSIIQVWRNALIKSSLGKKPILQSKANTVPFLLFKTAHRSRATLLHSRNDYFHRASVRFFRKLKEITPRSAKKCRLALTSVGRNECEMKYELNILRKGDQKWGCKMSLMRGFCESVSDEEHWIICLWNFDNIRNGICNYAKMAVI